jgi:hypothetical protein
MSTGWTISAYILSGLIVCGGIGFLIDWWLGTPKVFTAIGMVAGAAVSTWWIYVKYGRGEDASRRS